MCAPRGFRAYNPLAIRRLTTGRSAAAHLLRRPAGRSASALRLPKPFNNPLPSYAGFLDALGPSDFRETLSLSGLQVDTQGSALNTYKDGLPNFLEMLFKLRQIVGVPEPGPLFNGIRIR